MKTQIPSRVNPNGRFWFEKWARCLPHMGNVLAPVGHGACPTWARSVRDPCPKHTYMACKLNRYDLHKNTRQNTPKTPNKSIAKTPNNLQNQQEISIFATNHMTNDMEYLKRTADEHLGLLLVSSGAALILSYSI